MLQGTLVKLLRMSMSGSSRDLEHETAAVETLRNHLSLDFVYKPIILSKRQQKKHVIGMNKERQC